MHLKCRVKHEVEGIDIVTVWNVCEAAINDDLKKIWPDCNLTPDISDTAVVLH